MIEQENIPYTADEIKTMVKTCEKYYNVLEKAEQIYNSDFKPDEAAILAKYLPMIFPELKMSEEERIKKALIKILNEIVINTNYKELGIDYNIRDMIAWLEKQDKSKESDEEWEVTTGLYKCTKQMFDGSPESKLLFETGKLYKCISKNDIAEFESSYGHSVFLIDPVVKKHFIKVKDTIDKQDGQKSNSQMEKCSKCQFNFTGYCDGTCILENNNQKSADKIEPKFKPGDRISDGRYMKKIVDINSDYPYYMFQDGSSYHIKDIDTKWHIIPNADELQWMNVHTDEDHCYSCELFDRKNNICKCITLCKDPHNTYKGFYVR